MAVSGEYGECGKISQLNSDNFFATLFATCGLALSRWKITLFLFTKPDRFSASASLNFSN